MAISPDQIQAYIQRVMNNPNLSTDEMITRVGQNANTLGIGIDQLAANSPFTAEQYTKQFNRLGIPIASQQQPQVPVQQAPVAQPVAPQPANQPQYGLQGAEQAQLMGAGLGLNQINRTRGAVTDAFNQGIQGLQPFSQGGGQAFDLQSALSGALGPEAQAEAFQNFQSSPGQQFLQEQGERALTRNAAALGGLGGGNVRQELVRFGQGLAQQDFGNYFNRLGQVAQPGLSAATTIAGQGGQLAGIQAGLGQTAANIPFMTGQNIGQQRFQTGRDIASTRQQTTSALANLMNQQGAGLSDIVGGAAQNLNNLYQMAAQGDANARQQLGAILANLSAQQGSQVGGLPIIPGASTNMLGQLGQLAGGIGGIISGYGEIQGGTQPAGSVDYSSYNPTSGFWQAPSMIAP